MDVEDDDKLNVGIENECLSESNLINNEGDNEAAAGKNNKLKSNYKTYISPSPLCKIPGHTGFLTVATKL